MEQNKYERLDAAICAHLRTGRGAPTNSSALEAIARELLESGTGGRAPFPVAWRMIDRRMRAMRKAGRIVYGKPIPPHMARWRVVDA